MSGNAPIICRLPIFSILKRNISTKTNREYTKKELKSVKNCKIVRFLQSRVSNLSCK